MDFFHEQWVLPHFSTHIEQYYKCFHKLLLGCNFQESLIHIHYLKKKFIKMFSKHLMFEASLIFKNILKFF